MMKPNTKTELYKMVQDSVLKYILSGSNFNFVGVIEGKKINSHMAISKKSYEELKEYWDYQRKIEYNKEMVHFMAEKFKGRVYNDFGMVHIDEMKDLLWTRIDLKINMKNQKKVMYQQIQRYRFEWEGEEKFTNILITI